MLSIILLTIGIVAVPFHIGVAQSDDDLIKAARSVIKADRQAVVADSMNLTETEAQKFWPLYHQYRAEMDTLGDSLMNLVKEYASYYPNVPEDRAKKMLKDLARLEKKQLNTRAAYFKKFGKVLPAAKTLRFAQVENRLDLVLRLELAAAIPLVPIEEQ